MSKTTFLGYVPSLKSKHEATIVEGKAIESKGGSIRYTLRGEYKGRKTLPKTVTKADFEGVYGFDAKEAEAVIIVGKDGNRNSRRKAHIVGVKENDDFTPEAIVPVETSRLDNVPLSDNFLNHEADTVGSPSPASVEPPAPSEDPFPQEPSNASFSAEYGDCEYCDEKITDGGITTNDDNYYHDYCFDTLVTRGVRSETEIKETFNAFGFGKEDEEEEPKEQEFTVVLQEGDKLELTDIEQEETPVEEPKEEDNTEDEENDEKEDESDEEVEEKEAEMDKGILMICPSCDETVPEYSSCMSCGQQFESEYKAVSAKITRPVKEEEEEEKEEEGMSTLMKVGLGVGALAVGAAILGAEDEGESDYWAGENAEWRAEGSGELDHDRIDTDEYTEVTFRHDHPMTFYDWNSDKETLTDDETDEVDDEVSSEIGGSPSEGEDEFSIDVDGVGNVDVQTNTDYGDKRFYGLAAEDLTSSEFVPFDQITSEIQQEWDETTAPIAADYEPSNEPSNSNFSAESKLHPGLYRYKGKIGMRKGWTECQECDDIVKQKDVNWYYIKGYGQATICDSCVGKYNYKKDRLSKGGRHGELAILQFMEQDRKGAENFSADTSDIALSQEEIEEIERGMDIDLSSFKQRIANGASAKNVIETYRIRGRHNRKELMDYERRLYETETVGSPSPSGPPSIPEPAEATGSEPSNENFEADRGVCDYCLSEDCLCVYCKSCNEQRIEGEMCSYCEVCTIEDCCQCYNCPKCGVQVTFEEDVCDVDAGGCGHRLQAESESKNMNWVIGLTVLGVGVAALGYSDKILALFDRFKK